MTSDERRRVLADGNVIPTLGLGVPPHRHRPGRQQRDLRRTSAARQRRPPGGGLHHDEVLPRAQRSGAEAEGRRGRLGVDQIDLHIVHRPQKGPTWAWPGTEAAQERIQANAEVFGFELSGDQINALDGLDHTGATAEAREGKWW